jgi:selenocysteine lyase/cysteine desulfurase
MRVFSRFVELPGLRAEFPVLARLAYLNAGTDGPLPARAVRAAAAELEREAEQGRAPAHFERRAELSGKLRALYAAVLGCETTDLALTTSTSEGLAQVIGGLELGRGDEIVTSDEEHPGLQGALVAARGCR